MTDILSLSILLDSLTPSLIGLIGLTLVIYYLLSVFDFDYLGSFVICLTLIGLTLYLTQDLVSVLIVFCLWGLLTIRDLMTVNY